MSSLIMFLFISVILLFITPSLAYVDLGYATMPFEPQYDAVPRPHQLPKDIYIRFDTQPSMITAIAPSVTIAANGTYDTMYSVHYHDYFTRRRVGKGVFKRGVFANDPPIATCTPCGGSNITGTGVPTSTSSLSCTIHTYTGVFRFPETSSASTSYCYDSNYGGVFKPSTTSSTGLPCCFTIPASCLANSSSITYTYTSGVFRSSSTMSYYSNITTSSSSSSTTTTASPSSSQALTTPSSTTTKLSTTSSSLPTSTTAMSRPVTSIGTAVPGSSTVSSMSSGLSPGQISSSSSSSSLSQVSITSSVLYTSSYLTSGTSLGLSSIQSSGASMTSINSQSNGPRPGSSTASTLTVITAVPTMPSRSPVILTTTANNTVVGCGTASGSGIVVGVGTVYVGPAGLIPVVSSGTVSGYAATVVGCGTLTATTGSFGGSATIVACGFGSGTATMTGTGTVWPAIGGGLISFVSSGIITGSGSVKGCGTLTGSGTFSATGPYIETITTTPTALPGMTTVEVYLSYCPTNAAPLPLPRLGSNFTSQPSQLNNSTMVGYDSSETSMIDETTFCHPCPKQAGICCPPGVACEDDGTCPWQAVINAGYVLEGYNLVDIRNSTAPLPERRRRDAKH